MGDAEGQGGLGGPYGDLYLYVIQGVVAPDDEQALGNDFLGTWLEGESSFLFFTSPFRDRIDFLLGGRPALCLVEEQRISWISRPTRRWQISTFLLRFF